MKVYYRVGKKPEGFYSKMMLMFHCYMCCYEFDIKGESLDLYMIEPEGHL